MKTLLCDMDKRLRACYRLSYFQYKQDIGLEVANILGLVGKYRTIIIDYAGDITEEEYPEIEKVTIEYIDCENENSSRTKTVTIHKNDEIKVYDGDIVEIKRFDSNKKNPIELKLDVSEPKERQEFKIEIHCEVPISNKDWCECGKAFQRRFSDEVNRLLLEEVKLFQQLGLEIYHD